MESCGNLPDGWQEYFDELILERGRQYFKEERVSSLAQTEDGYSANVEGSSLYDVFVGFSDGELKFECNCPYAEDGNSCKHMAAVCFAIEQKPKIKTKHATKKKPDVFQLLENADEEQMRSFLQKNVLVRREFAEMFAVWVQKKISPKDFSAYRARMLREISAGLRHFQNYEYHNEYGCFQEISTALDASIGLMLKRGFLREAFLLVQAAVECILEWDDEGMCLDGWYNDLETDIFSLLEKIAAENTDAKLEREMFVWLAEQKYAAKWSYLDTVWKILMENFPGYTREKLEALDKRIAEETWGQLILYKLELMEELGYSEEDIRRVVEAGWNFSVVRDRSFEGLYAKGDLRGAADILQD
ncbi:MAG: hypothetical protein Q4Q04_01130, partial [Methanocorpusculum sp.]|nr:hypothetical protein [Methanocorpusculum sp.]